MRTAQIALYSSKGSVLRICREEPASSKLRWCAGPACSGWQRSTSAATA